MRSIFSLNQIAGNDNGTLDLNNDSQISDNQKIEDENKPDIKIQLETYNSIQNLNTFPKIN